MTVSGTSVFDVTRNEICRQAALLLNAVSLNGTMSAPSLNSFIFMLNAMVKAWQSTGIHVWTVTEGVLFPQPGQISYGAGVGAVDHITQSYSETAITADEAVGQTTLSVDDPTNFTIGDNIGVVLDDGTIQWSTVTVVGASSVTQLDALTDSASQSNAVFNYTNKIVRPLKVVDARRYDIVSATDTPMTMASRLEYRNLTLKTAPGTPVQLYYDAQLGIGRFYLWQVSESTTDLIKFTWHRPIMDFNTAGDTPDLPQEWILPLVYNLAKWMMPQHPVSPMKANQIMDGADSLLGDLLGFDRENESLFISPDLGP